VRRMASVMPEIEDELQKIGGKIDYETGQVEPIDSEDWPHSAVFMYETANRSLKRWIV
jgi:hypothetical protein